MPDSAVIPGFEPAVVERFAATWDDAGLWGDVTALACRFWGAESDEDRTVRWHHLVLAVGNFKRQSGRRLRPVLEISDGHGGEPPSSFDVPGVSPAVVVGIDDAPSWQALERSLPGAAVATVTTLLAALWPDDHFVFDWRVAAAANGLRINAGLAPTDGIDPDGTSTREITCADYDEVRRWLIATARAGDSNVATVERALYRLSQSVRDVEGRTWRRYGADLAALL